MKHILAVLVCTLCGVTFADSPKPNVVYIPFASWGGRQEATDWIEFDIAFSRNTPKRHAFYTPMRGNDNKPAALLFKKGIGIDQHGREQANGPGPQNSESLWERRIIGLCTNAPGPLGKHAIVFSGGKSGTYTVYLDNLRLRHTDGSSSAIWANGKDIRNGKFEDTELFTNVRVRTVAVGDILK